MTTAHIGLPAPTDDLDRAEDDLREHGICAVPGVLAGDALAEAQAALATVAAQERRRGRHAHYTGDAADDHTNQRVWNLLSKSPDFVDLVEHPVALGLVRSVLGWPVLLGNMSANITGPGGGEMQLHADQQFAPEPWPVTPAGANVAWCIDDFTADNGATQFVPGSHLLNRAPRPEDHPNPVPMEAPAGSLVVFDSRLWHRTGFNRTADRRRGAAFAWYTRPIYRPQENWFLALDPTVVQFASDQLLTLLGYKTRTLGLVNGRSPR